MATLSTAETLAGLDDLRADLEALYRDLHRHPELSHQETRTAGLVAGRLGQAGYDVTTGIGGTGVVGILRNGAGPGVLLRADMDGLPVREATGLDYASTTTATDSAGNPVPVMHACGHDVHVACLCTAATLLANGRDHWRGTLIALFQPAEEVGNGARGMVDDGLRDLVGSIDVALAQHVLALPAGTVGTRPGAVFSGSNSVRVTVHGRGGHGSMPHTTVDPVVLAAMIVIRLQTIVSREIAPTDPAVLTVGSIHAGSKSNIIGDSAVIELSLRTYSEQTRARALDAIRRIVMAECDASGASVAPEIEVYEATPVTINDEAVTARTAAAFADIFADDALELPLQTASEDFGDLPAALGAAYTYWGLGGTDPQAYAEAVLADRVASDIPVNHSPYFAPVMQPTLDRGTQAMVVAALAHLDDNG